MSTKTGQCLCGAVRFKLNADPISVRVCWCRDCQRIAANGSVSVIAPAEAVEVDGELSDYVSTASSGNQITRRFCSKCGAHVLAKSSARPQFTVLRAGTFDDPSAVGPSMNIWVRSAPTWACLDPKLERVEEQPGAARPFASR